MSAAGKRRHFGLDLIRAVSLYFVIAEHYFLHTDFYSVPLQGWGMALSAFVRMPFMTCIPLFLMLSGWLCAERRWDGDLRGYLRGLLPVLVVWLLSSGLCQLFRIFCQGEPYTLFGSVSNILSYAAAPYSWYVEMYIGLYLMMPFLNAAWDSLDRKGRAVMTLAFTLLSVLPTVTNLRLRLLPEWWIKLYPIAYYCFGLWVKRYPLRTRSLWLLAGWLGSSAAAAAMRWVFAGGGPFEWAAYADTNGPFTAFGGMCVFSVLERCSGARAPGFVRRVVEWMSRLCLPAMLLSYIFEQLVYPHVLRAGLPYPTALLLLPPATLAIALCSCLLAWPVSALSRALTALVPGGARPEQREER